MVNENQGKVYSPNSVYNRKMLRNIIRERAVEVKGNHDVSKYMSRAFKEIRENMLKQEEK